jgi:hypothetical protein
MSFFVTARNLFASMSATDSYCSHAGSSFPAAAASHTAYAEPGSNSLVSRIERIIPVVLSQVNILVL